MQRLKSFVTSDGTRYNIPANRESEFLADFGSDAKPARRFRTDDGTNYTIPSDQVESFRADFPGAMPLSRFEFSDGSSRDFTPQEMDEFVSGEFGGEKYAEDRRRLAEGFGDAMSAIVRKRARGESISRRDALGAGLPEMSGAARNALGDLMLRDSNAAAKKKPGSGLMMLGGGSVDDAQATASLDDELAREEAAVAGQDATRADLGVFGTLHARREAELGRKTGGVEAALRETPFVGSFMNIVEKGREIKEQTLFNGRFQNPLEAAIIARNAGMPQESINAINAEANDIYQRSLDEDLDGSVAREKRMDFIRAKYREFATEKLKNRLLVRQQAGERLSNSELDWLQEIGVGAIGAGQTIAEMANPATAAGTFGLGFMGRGADLARDEIEPDENGDPVVVRQGEDDGKSVLKAAGSALADRVIWSGLTNKALKALPWGKKLAKTVEHSGFLTKNAAELQGMVFKSRLTELVDDVGGLNRKASDGNETLSEWAQRFFSPKENVRTMLEMLPVHAAMKGMHWAKGKFDGTAAQTEKIRERLVANGVSKETMRSLSDNDVNNLYRVFSSKGMTDERIGRMVDDMARDERVGVEQLRGAQVIASARGAAENPHSAESLHLLDGTVAERVGTEDAAFSRAVREKVAATATEEDLNDPARREYLVENAARFLADGGLNEDGVARRGLPPKGMTGREPLPEPKPAPKLEPIAEQPEVKHPVTPDPLADTPEYKAWLKKKGRRDTEGNRARFEADMRAKAQKQGLVPDGKGRMVPAAPKVKADAPEVKPFVVATSAKHDQVVKDIKSRRLGFEILRGHTVEDQIQYETLSAIIDYRRNPSNAYESIYEAVGALKDEPPELQREFIENLNDPKKAFDLIYEKGDFEKRSPEFQKRFKELFKITDETELIEAILDKSTPASKPKAEGKKALKAVSGNPTEGRGQTVEKAVSTVTRDTVEDEIDRLMDGGDSPTVAARTPAGRTPEALRSDPEVVDWAKKHGRTVVGGKVSPGTVTAWQKNEVQKVAHGLRRVFGDVKVEVVDRPWSEEFDGSVNGVRRLVSGDDTVVGTFNERTKEIRLYRGADGETVWHELGGHAVMDWAQRNAPSLHRKMIALAADLRRTPFGEEVARRYAGADDATLAKELVANFIQGRGADLARFRELPKGFFARAYTTVRDALVKFLGHFGYNRVSIERMDGMTPTEAMDYLVKELAKGKTLGKLGSPGEGGRMGLAEKWANKFYDQNTSLGKISKAAADEKALQPGFEADFQVRKFNPRKEAYTEALRRTGIAHEEIAEYMKAVAAKERNAADGRESSGLSDAQIAATLEHFERHPRIAEIRRIADGLWKMQDEGLRERLRSGLISEGDYSEWTAREKHHVPFRSAVDENGEYAGWGRGRGLAGGEFVQHEGRFSESGDPIAWMFEEYADAHLRAIENDVRAVLAKEIRANRALGRISTDPGLREQRVKGGEGSPNVVNFKEIGANGESVVRSIVLDGERGAMAAAAYTNRELKKVPDAPRRAMRFWSSTATEWSPTFGVRNTVKDNTDLSLVVFATEVKGGKSDAEAALFSRRVTVDFNRHGDWTPAFSVLRLFSNSTLGATARAAVALGKSRYGRAMALAMFSNGLAQALIEHFYNLDEDERRRETGEATGKDVSEFERKTSLFYVRSGDRLDKVAQHGSPFSLITYAGNCVGRWLCGDMNGGDVARELGVSTAELAYSLLPMGSINLLSRKGGFVNDLKAAIVSGVVPSVLQPISELALNVDFKGDPVLRTMMNDYDPRSYNGNQHTPEWAKQSAEWMNDATGGNAGRRGFIDIAPEAIQKLVEGYGKNALRDVSAAYSIGKAILTGDVSGLDPRNTPVKRDFVRPLDGNDRRFNDALTSYRADRNEFAKMKDGWTDAERREYVDGHPWVADKGVGNAMDEIRKLRRMEQGYWYKTGRATPHEWTQDEQDEFKSKRRRLQAMVLKRMGR